MRSGAATRGGERDVDVGPAGASMELGRPVPRARTTPAFKRISTAAAADAIALEAEYKGRLAEIDGAGLASLIERYEALEDRTGRAFSYAQLLFAATRDDAEVGRFYQGVQERITAIGTHLLFVTLELNRWRMTPGGEAGGVARLRHFAPWLDTVRSFRPHQLSDELEKALHEKHVTGRSAWVRLFDETMAALRFPLDGKELTSAEIFDLMSSKDRGVRERPPSAISGVLAAECPAVRPDHEHLGQGQADRGRLAPVRAPDLLAQPRQPGRGRGGRRADRGRPRRLPADLAPLLRAEGPLAGSGAVGVLGPQRAAAGGRRPPPAWPDAKVVVLDAYRRFSPQLAGDRRPLLPGDWIDAAAASRQGQRRILPSDGAERPSLYPDELRADTRRDDPGARARPRRAPGAGGPAGP